MLKIMLEIFQSNIVLITNYRTFLFCLVVSVLGDNMKDNLSVSG